MFRLPERRSLNDPSIPLSNEGILSYLGAGMTTDSGVAVSEFSSLQMTTVWRCVSLISSAIAGLPLRAYTDFDGYRQEVGNDLLTNPHPQYTRYEVVQQALLHVLLWGNAYWLKVPNQGGDRIARILPLQPWMVDPRRVTGNGYETNQKVYVTSYPGAPSEPLTDDEIVHFPGLGYDGLKGLSRIAYLRQAIALSLAAESFGARLFGSGSMIGGVLQTETKLDRNQAMQIKNDWKERMSGLARAHEVAVLDSGLKWVPVAIPPEDSQFMETRRFAVEEVARFYGVPPFMVGAVDKTTSWGAGISAQGEAFVRYTLSEYMVPMEQRISGYLLPSGIDAEFDTDRLLRGDAAARWSVYATARAIGAYSVNDIRRKEGDPPIPGGDVYGGGALPAPPAPGVPPDTGKAPAGV